MMVLVRSEDSFDDADYFADSSETKFNPNVTKIMFTGQKLYESPQKNYKHGTYMFTYSNIGTLWLGPEQASQQLDFVNRKREFSFLLPKFSFRF